MNKFAVMLCAADIHGYIFLCVRTPEDGSCLAVPRVRKRAQHASLMCEDLYNLFRRSVPI